MATSGSKSSANSTTMADKAMGVDDMIGKLNLQEREKDDLNFDEEFPDETGEAEFMVIAKGRAESGRPSVKELQDDASSPHKAGDGNKHEGEKSRKRLTYEEPATEPSSSKLPLLLEAVAVGVIPMEDFGPNLVADGEEEDDVSSQDSKRSKTGCNTVMDRPPEGLYKLNVDAGFSGDSGTGSTGAVLRSDRGVFIAGSCSAISFAEDASSAEARALRDGLILASKVGVQKS
ncbi:hypothetical protein D1007_44309 [Hordeum vulgare]|nr:hypothetical protein D1007_44309 [Hordeum vulgare]